MVLLQLLPVDRKSLVVKEVVSQVIAYVSKYSTAEDRCCHGPIPIEDSMCQPPEWGRENQEKRRRHH